ncbi:MAG TPA: hypothetical protein EYM29_04820, partial [Rhodospirillales bacterium]|nr:hypothetical protein [Rhodospirillales bacterium]
MTKRFLELIRRGWRKPPHVIVRWLVRQARGELDQYMALRRTRRTTLSQLLTSLEADSLASLWTRLAEAPFCAFAQPITPEDYDKACPGDVERIMVAADAVLSRRVDLLGSG